MDYKILYRCIDCGTNRYLIFPNRNESLIICSACYRERNVLLENQEQDRRQVLRSCCEKYCSAPN